MALRLGERGLEHLDLVRPLHFGLGVGEPRLGLGDAGFRRRDRGLLLGAFQREDRIALLDGGAFLDAEREHAAALLGADQHQIGLHIAGELRVLVGREGEQHDGHGDCGETGEQEQLRDASSLLSLAALDRLAPRRPDRIGQKLDIGGEQPVGVEVMVPLEQGAPQDGGERRRDQQLRKLAQARLAETRRARRRDRSARVSVSMPRETTWS